MNVSMTNFSFNVNNVIALVIADSSPLIKITITVITVKELLAADVHQWDKHLSFEIYPEIHKNQSLGQLLNSIEE